MATNIFNSMMRKCYYAIIAFVFFFVSCDKIQEVAMDDSGGEPVAVNPQASLFYSNLSEIIKATTIPGLMTKSALDAEMNHTAAFYLENDIDYPVQARLATIDIETEDGDIISFYDLPEEDQVEFVDMYTQHQAQLLSEKIEQLPVLEQYVEAQNEVVAEVLAGNSVNTKSGGYQIDDPRAFFAEMSSRIDSLSTSFEYDTESIRSKSGSYTSGKFEVEYEKVIRLIDNKAKRGDIIVALPCHENPRSLIDFGNKKYLVGHAEIFTKNITASTKKEAYTTIGSWKDDGVQDRTLENWCWKSYLVGVCSYKVKWKWRGLKSRFYAVKTPVSNPSLLAAWAEKYEDRAYVKDYEFLTAKWAAPTRFTCTTLVWWCTKKAYGERISPWYSTLVTPSDVLCDNNTYLKVTIE